MKQRVYRLPRVLSSSAGVGANLDAIELRRRAVGLVEQRASATHVRIRRVDGKSRFADLQVRDGVIEIRPVRRNRREGWDKDAQRLAGEGGDALVWPELANEGDGELVW